MPRPRFSPSLLLLVAAACSSGPGRPLARPDGGTAADAEPRPDAPAVRDSGVDAGFADMGLADAGPPLRFPFTGVFGILNDAAPLYAREDDGRLTLVVGGYPYIYHGTISEAGAVATVGVDLEAAGCPRARIDGLYGRGSAGFRLTHDTCSLVGQPIGGQIQGAFAADFGLDRSGVYALRATVTLNLGGCYAGPPAVDVRYAVHQLPNLGAQLVTIEDLIDTQAVYFGRFQPGLDRATLTQTVEVAGSAGVSMSAVFSRTSANVPWRLTGTRDVYDPVRGCPFRVELDGVRVRAP